MDANSELPAAAADHITLADGNIYEQIYLQDVDVPVLDCNSVQMEQFDSTTDGSLNILYERELPQGQAQVYSLKEESTVILNSNATEDESMAVEALRQLGSSAVYTKIPQDLPLLICSNCDMQFQTTADFQNHSAICKHSQLKCYVCNEMFERTVDFNNHLVGHAVDRPHSCRICSTLFVHEKDFIEHLQSHSSSVNTNQCKVCGVIFQRPSSLTNHMKIHTYQPGRAILSSLMLARTEVGNYTTVSEDLNSKHFILPSLNHWEDYELTRADDFYINLDVAQEMTIGNSEDDKSNVVANNYEYVNDKSVDNEEEASSVEPIHQNAAETETKRPHICKYCNKTFAREKALLSHHKLHSSVLQTYSQCKNCDGYLTDEESLIKHSLDCREKPQLINIKPTHANKISNVVEHTDEKQPVGLIDNPKTKFYKHVCSHCSKRFSTKQKLHRHMWIHRKKTFSCEICARSFEKQEELDAHRLSTHQGNSAYVCNECGKCFSSRQGLWEHNRVHGNTSHLFKCIECSKTFSSRQGYLIHKRAHNDERPYGCRFCWKSFRDGGTLRKHERIHTGERPHACPLCTRAFNQKVVLREHVRWLHAANRQPNENGVYDCTLCDQKLTDKDDLCAHIVKHSDHLALLAKDASKNNIKLPTTLDTSKSKRKHSKVRDNNKVIIEIIPSVNANSDLLIEDVQKPLIECDLCGDKFLNEEDLSEHVRIHI